MLKRVKAVPKAAWSPPEERPLPLEHYESMEVQKLLSDPNGWRYYQESLREGKRVASHPQLNEVEQFRNYSSSSAGSCQSSSA
jgi:hypothetical protein